MTKIEAVKYGIDANERRRECGLEELTIIMEKDGSYLAGTWSEQKYAESHGWKYVNTIADLAKELKLA